MTEALAFAITGVLLAVAALGYSTFKKKSSDTVRNKKKYWYEEELDDDSTDVNNKYVEDSLHSYGGKRRRMTKNKGVSNKKGTSKKKGARPRKTKIKNMQG